MALAKEEAARAAVKSGVKGSAQDKAKAAYNKAYQEAIDDGLSEDTAKKLAKFASDETFTNTETIAQAATSGIAPTTLSTTMDLQQLRSEWMRYRHMAGKKRA